MNQVSWLIYLSGVIGQLATLIVFVGICVLIIAAVYFGFSWYMVSEIDHWNESDGVRLEALKLAKDTRRWCPTLAVLTCVLWIIAALCPSQQVVLAIAASEFGEQLLHTKTANLAEQALDSWLQRQIHPADIEPAK